MPRLLGIETATDVCAVALWRAGEIVSGRTIGEPRRHAEQLVPMIAAVLKEAGWQPDDLDGVAVSGGPGSYTGLRIGVSTAKGLALASNLAMVSVPTLEALAAGADSTPGARILVALRARKDEVFVGLFINDAAGRPIQQDSVQALDPTSALQTFAHPSRTLVLAGDGVPLLRAAAGPVPAGWTWQPDLKPDARIVAQLGAVRLAEGRTVDVEMFEPYYLKPFVARHPTRTAFERLPF